MAVEMQLTCERVVSIIAPVLRLREGGEQLGSLWELKHLSLVLQEDGGGPSDEAALILHRKGFDCAFSNRNTGLLCATTQGKIHTEKLFSELRFQSIIPVSLTLMHTTEGGSSKEEIRLKPMEISTYRVQLT